MITESTAGPSPRVPLVGQDVSTPLEEDEPERAIPGLARCRAMKERRHAQWHLLAGPRAARADPGVPGGSTTTPSTASTTGGSPRHDRPPRSASSPERVPSTSLAGPDLPAQRYEELRDEVVPLVDCYSTRPPRCGCAGWPSRRTSRSSNVFDVAALRQHRRRALRGTGRVGPSTTSARNWRHYCHVTRHDFPL